MSPGVTAVDRERGSVAAIKELVKIGDRISVEEMSNIVQAGEAAGGALLSIDSDGEWCGMGRFRFKWPPRVSGEFVEFLDGLVDRRINFEVLINGIPAPDEIMVKVSRHQWR